MNEENDESAPVGHRNRHRRLRFRWAYIPLLAFMAFFTYAYLQKTQEIHRLSVEQAALLTQNRATLLENGQLQQANRYRRTQQYEIETARSRLGWTAPGETSIQVQTVTPPVLSVRRVRSAVIVPPTPVWQQWWDAFFD